MGPPRKEPRRSERRTLLDTALREQMLASARGLVNTCGLSFPQGGDQATASPPWRSIARSSLMVTISPQPPHSPPVPTLRHIKLQELHLRSPRRRSWQLEHSYTV